jgi:hypothetical protein
MDSPARRAFSLLRQHSVLLFGPWLGVVAATYAVGETVRQISNRMFPVADLQALRASGYANSHVVLANSMRASLIRQGAVGCAEILEYAVKVVALALTIVLVTQVATHGGDTLPRAMERLRRIPGFAGTSVKLFLLVLLLGLGTTLIAAVPLALYVPWQIAHSGPHAFVPFPRWASTLSADVGRLLFVCCIMPFFLYFVAHFEEQQSSRGVDDREGLLGRSMAYGVAAVVAESGLALLLRPFQLQLAGPPALGLAIQQSLIGLATNLITSTPTIVCVVAIVLLTMKAEAQVTEAEPA